MKKKTGKFFKEELGLNDDDIRVLFNALQSKIIGVKDQHFDALVKQDKERMKLCEELEQWYKRVNDKVFGDLYASG